MCSGSRNAPRQPFELSKDLENSVTYWSDCSVFRALQTYVYVQLESLWHFKVIFFSFNLWKETQVWKGRAMGPLEDMFYQVHLKLWEDCCIIKADWGICLSIKNMSLCYATPLFSTGFYWGTGYWFFQNKFSAVVEHREGFLPCVSCFCSILDANFLSDL